MRLLKFPLGSGIRVDTGIAQGDVIPPDYDSMVAKIIAWGRDRNEALARARTALRETTVVIDGGTTNKSFLLGLLDRDEVISATADTGWLDRTGAATATGPTPTADIALIAAAIDAYEAEESLERAGFLASARGGRPRATHAIGRTVELTYQGQAYRLTVGQISPHTYRLGGDSGELIVDVERLSEYESRLTLGNQRFHIVTVAGPTGFLVEVDGISHRISQDEAGLLRAGSPAVVVAMPVAVGDEVEAGATLVVLESMKMETALRAPAAGRVREIFATVNSQVDAGAALLRFDQAGESTTAEALPRVQFRTQPRSEEANPRTEALARLDELRALITGYDVNPGRARILLTEYHALRGSLPRDDQELVEAEIGLLDTFADICELSRNRPTLDEEDIRRERPQPTRALPFLPAFPRRRGGGAAAGVSHQDRSRAAQLRHRHARARSRAGRSGLPAIPRVAAHGEPGPCDHRAAWALAHRRRRRIRVDQCGGRGTRAADSCDAGALPRYRRHRA